VEAGGDPPADLLSLLAGHVVDAARGLLGAWLVRGDAASLRIGRIVETEAYDGSEDLASHARFGRTTRNGSMFGPAGHAYVYGVYGMHTCLNVVCGPPDRPAAVLVRAVEPVTGVAEMREGRRSRGLATRRADRDAPDRAAARIATLPAARLASGPGNIGAAFSIVPEDDGRDLLDAASPLRLEARPSAEPAPAVASGPRIGVAFAGAWAERPWRFWVVGSTAVSGGRGR
jgi:DNA-3-methyladenine glycosylase